MTEQITKTFRITGRPNVLRRIERFLSMLHYNGRFGHSGTFGVWFDGDGSDRVSVDPKPGNPGEVGAIGGVGYHVEIAGDDSYSGVFVDRSRPSHWSTGVEDGCSVLLKDGEVIDRTRRL